MKDDKNNQYKIGSSGSSGPWWKDATVLFSEISAWIVGPIVVALISGKILDSRYGTKPWFFIGFAVIGFLITAFGIMRTVRKYAKSIDNKNKEEKKNL